MRFDIVTIFPGFFAVIFEHGIVRRALAEGLAAVEVHDLRAFTHDRHRTVDDRPFGGGEGMVLKPEPLGEALASLGIEAKNASVARARLPSESLVAGAEAPAYPPEFRGQSQGKMRVILLSAQGRRFTQSVARELACYERIVLLCGRYEGVDERVNLLYCDEELSIGDYVLSGGELAAAVVVDAVTRLLPGALGNEA
jgi:tRNA (guanine37-N1)-methyltransferase